MRFWSSGPCSPPFDAIKSSPTQKLVLIFLGENICLSLIRGVYTNLKNTSTTMRWRCITRRKRYIIIIRMLLKCIVTSYK
jgi:hypothetical protein